MESEKHQSQQGGDERSVRLLNHHSKRRREESETCCIIGNLWSLLNITTDDIVGPVTDLVQRLVREECERRLFQRSIINDESTGGAAKYFKLVFNKELPDTILTKSKIKAKDDTLVEIALYDIRSQSIVTDGPLSSMKAELCVLNGDFDKEEWTSEQFKGQIISQRDNKGKLLAGDTVIALENGVGYIHKIMFTDNSSWTGKSQCFRLGARGSNETNMIMEGRSKPFRVKENRGELNQKHYPPFPNDELSRLTKISKNGITHKLLSSQGINTVNDLVQLHETDPSSLQEKFGQTSKKRREEIIEHAKTCVTEVTLNGQNYHSPNALNSDHEHLVERVKQQVCNNLKDLMPLETALALPGVQAAQYGGPDQGLQQFEFPIAQQGQPETWPSTSTLVGSDQLSVLGQFTPGAYIDDGNRMAVSVSETGAFASYFTPKDHWEQVLPFSFPYGDGAECSNHYSFPNSAVYISNKGKGKTVWRKIRAVLKWVKLHVTKRNAKLFHHPY